MGNPKFGSAGNPDSFYEAGYKESIKMPEYLNKAGLDAYEYQCGKGVRISENTAKRLGDEAIKNNIILSVHSPYYINLANPDPEKRENNIRYITDTLRIAKVMGAKRIVVHSGSVMKMTRQEALENALITLQKAIERADSLGYSDIHICPETMGKINQLGDLDETLELCRLDERLIPCIDFGHLNARTLGGLSVPGALEEIFEKVENKLGIERMKNFHSHFSKIEYTKGGERKHLTFDDTEYGPEFEPLAELIVKKGADPIIICESDSTQARDALIMKKIYREAAMK